MSRSLLVKLHVPKEVLSLLEPEDGASFAAAPEQTTDKATLNRQYYEKYRRAFREGMMQEPDDWDKCKWKELLRKNQGAFADMYEALGLVADSNRKKHPFPASTVRALSHDVLELAERVAALADSGEIVRVAHTATLDGDITNMLAKHGEKIWGKNSRSSSHLREPAADTLYRRHLDWEDTDDRKW